jgi:hypothetical protein
LEQHVVKRFWELFEAFHRGRLLFGNFYGKMRGLFAKRQKDVVEFYKNVDFSTLMQVQERYFSEAVRAIDDLLVFGSEIGDLSSVESPLKILHHRIFITLEHYQEIVSGVAETERGLLEENDALIRRYLEEVFNLLYRCVKGLDSLARRVADEKLFLRSLFLHGESVLGGAEGKGEFLRKIYAHGAVELYFKVAYDFYKSGFFIEARDAMEKLYRAISHHKAKKEEMESIKTETDKLAQRITEAIKGYLGEVGNGG